MLVHRSKQPCPSVGKGVLYSITCNECSQTYIGQMSRSLDHHTGEHCRALKNGDVMASAIAEDVFFSGQQIDQSTARVVDAHPHTQIHCLESWHIQHEQGHNAGALCYPDVTLMHAWKYFYYDLFRFILLFH